LSDLLGSRALLLSHPYVDLLGVSMVAQLSEDPDRALRVKETDVETFCSLTRLLVDQLDTLVCELLKCFVCIGYSEGDVMDAFPTLLDELCDSAFRRGSFEQFDLRLTDLEEGCLHLLVSYFFDVVALQSEDTFVIRQRCFDTLYGDAKMLDV